MPFGMTGYVQSVRVQGTLYVGGGMAADNNEYIVMTYDISAGKWATLPPYSKRSFAMTAIDNHLVLVGGTGRDGVSKKLGVWSEDSKNWTNPYPDMTTGHFRCSAISYNPMDSCGRRLGRIMVSELSSVEVMNAYTKPVVCLDPQHQ